MRFLMIELSVANWTAQDKNTGEFYAIHSVDFRNKIVNLFNPFDNNYTELSFTDVLIFEDDERK